MRPARWPKTPSTRRAEHRFVSYRELSCLTLGQIPEFVDVIEAILEVVDPESAFTQHLTIAATFRTLPGCKQLEVHGDRPHV